ncbi:3'-5' exoribonuclease 1-like [Hetaerina americana]|uniref:3'-5' exoribonuclease 1-like n=1 Tax=Hetaerina americana TaxID=62018 RepID=UPI003A7F1CE0
MEWQNYQEGETSGIFAGNEHPPMRHPVYKELAVINCSIKMMRRNVLVETLKCFDLSVAGNYTVLSKRLRHYYKRKKLTEAGIPLKVEILPYYVIVDFEATCEEVNTPNYPHEIIEFPAVLVSTERKEIISHFQAFCRPTINPVLSDFCTELTGISQEQVDSADEFPTVLKNFEAWLKENLGATHNYAIVTDGPWDMGRFLYGQCKISEIEYPHFAHKWVNIRKIFHNFYDTKQVCLKLMLEYLDMTFEGRPHCGLDDAKNIARILLQLAADGAPLLPNERIHKPKLQMDFSGNHSLRNQRQIRMQPISKVVTPIPRS